MRLEDNINILASQKGLSAQALLQQIGVQQDIASLTPVALMKIASYFHLNVDQLLSKNLNFDERAAQADIRLLILDIDGVMTDGGMYFTENGDQIKKYNAKDGMAIIHLTKNNFPVGVISSGFTDNMIRQRVELLKIPRFHVGRNPKFEVLRDWMDDLEITIKQVAFIGDDINDLEIMEACGLAICPNDAVPAIQKIADIILSKKGGDGCVREYIDQYLIPHINLGEVRH